MTTWMSSRHRSASRVWRMMGPSTCRRSDSFITAVSLRSSSDGRAGTAGVVAALGAVTVTFAAAAAAAACGTPDALERNGWLSDCSGDRRCSQHAAPQHTLHG